MGRFKKAIRFSQLAKISVGFGIGLSTTVPND